MGEPFTPGEPGAPSDYTTMVEVLADLAADGFVENFTVTRDGKIRCGACRHVEDPTRMQLVDLRRLEGASDPDDEAAVLALVCGDCGARGATVVKYGPNATEEELAVLAAVEDHRRD
ncbi:MAG: hypothetical protein ACRD29_02340 [Acidimicrobiales bacterium]